MKGVQYHRDFIQAQASNGKRTGLGTGLRCLQFQAFSQTAAHVRCVQVEIELPWSFSTIPVEECGGVVDLRVWGSVLILSLSYRSDLTKKTQQPTNIGR